MTARLHDVLEDIASDLAPSDLTAAVSARAKRLRWMRRAVTGSAALGVAATVGVVTLTLPAWRGPAEREIPLPMASPTHSSFVDGVDLDAALPGGLDSATAVLVVSADDGTERAVAVDVRTGDAAILDVEIPAGQNTVALSSDGSRALIVGDASVAVVDLASGDELELERGLQQPYAISQDGSIVFTVVPISAGSGVADPPQWQLNAIDATTGEVTALPYVIARNKPPAELWPAPDGATLFLRFDDSMRDPRTHRIDLVTGEVTYTEPYISLPIEELHWSSDGTRMAAEMATSVRVLAPTDEIGTLQETVSKAGVPLGFVGTDQLVWGVTIPDGAELVVTDLSNRVVGTPTRVLTTGTIEAVATAL